MDDFCTWRWWVVSGDDDIVYLSVIGVLEE
jgi:hypothetical protein